MLSILARVVAHAAAPGPIHSAEMIVGVKAAMASHPALPMNELDGVRAPTAKG